MLDDLLLDELGRALVRVETLGPLLDDLLSPRQGSAVDSAGVAASVPGSRPPVSVPMVDLKIDSQRVLCGWVGCLVEDAPGEVGQAPVDRALAVQGLWLRERLAVLEVMPWAVVAAEEIIAQVWLLSDVVDPPVSRDDPAPIEEGACRVVASCARLLGRPVDPATVWRWAKSGRISHRLDAQGHMMVRLDEVLKNVRSPVTFHDATRPQVS